LDAHSTHELILDTSLREREIRRAPKGSRVGRTAVFERESWGNRLRYSNVKRNILLIGGKDGRGVKLWREENGNKGAYTLQHTVLLARLEEIDGTLADKVIVRIWRGTGECLDLSKFDANVFSLDSLGAQTNLDSLIEEGRVEWDDKMTSGETDPFDSGLRSIGGSWGNTGVPYNGN
jgi:hypothetical protein